MFLVVDLDDLMDEDTPSPQRQDVGIFWFEGGPTTPSGQVLISHPPPRGSPRLPL